MSTRLENKPRGRLLHWLLALVVSLSLLIACTPGAPGAIAPTPVTRAAPAANATELAELVAGNTTFAFDLYQALRSERDGNLVYSPYSLSLALAMAYAGARGETERQMADTLHFRLPQAQLHPAFNALDQELDRRGQGAGGADGQGFRLNVANALWGQEGYRFLPEFVDLLAADYGAEMTRLDFAREKKARSTINDWVSEQTEGKIQELIPAGLLDPMTRLVLTNAVYFNAAWARQFDPRATQDGIFYLRDGGSVSTPMMHQAAAFAYAEGPDYQAVVLPYDGYEIAMDILLPAEGQFEAVERSLDAGQVETMLEGLVEQQVALTLPRFEFESGFDLGAVLAAMGVPLAFTLQADFSGMTAEEGLLISDVIHQATISVGEAGTEAAAATAVVMPPSAIPEDFVTVVVDRPFLFLIRDLQTGTILFVGRVMDPRPLVDG
jgi:serpin B